MKVMKAPDECKTITLSTWYVTTSLTQATQEHTYTPHRSQWLRYFSPIRSFWSIWAKNLPFFFSTQTNPIKMLRVLFLRSDLSDRSDFVQSKATMCLDNPAPLSFVYIFTAEDFSLWRIFSGVIIEITFNRPTITTVCLFTFTRPTRVNNNSNITDIYIDINIFNCTVDSTGVAKRARVNANEHKPSQ